MILTFACMPGTRKATSRGLIRASTNSRSSTGITSMMGSPGGMTPPRVLISTVFTRPRTGDRISVRRNWSWRWCTMGSSDESSAFSLDRSV
ncbi:hypothetical protein D3C72_1619870 [compost metagenome]